MNFFHIVAVVVFWKTVFFTKDKTAEITFKGKVGMLSALRAIVLYLFRGFLWFFGFFVFRMKKTVNL